MVRGCGALLLAAVAALRRRSAHSSMLGAAQLVCRCSREPPVLRNGAETMRRLCTIGRSSGAGVDDAAADFVAGRTHRPAVVQGLMPTIAALCASPEQGGDSDVAREVTGLLVVLVQAGRACTGGEAQRGS